mmetsp:Transcript_10734/g.22160  ORF Transcript_10734/g.22160 Transcript_10734/m.22160 type:complete len:207 (+) Transcript_10734:191-811(+)
MAASCSARSRSFCCRHASCSASTTSETSTSLKPLTDLSSKISSTLTLSTPLGAPQVPGWTGVEVFMRFSSIWLPIASVTTPPACCARRFMYSSNEPGAPWSAVGILSGSRIRRPETGSRSPSCSLPDLSYSEAQPVFFCCASSLARSVRCFTLSHTCSALLICPRSAPAPLYGSLSLGSLQSTILTAHAPGRWTGRSPGKEDDGRR